MRLDKFLCDAGLGTRSEIKALIKSKAVKVNDLPITDPGFKINENIDKITYRDKAVYFEKSHYFMLNKPAGLVSATQDNLSRTVIDLFEAEGIKNLAPVGRLDKDTVGLLIVTDDGDLNHHLTSPKHHVNKTYYAELLHSLSEEDISKLETGIDLKEDGITKPAKIKVISEDGKGVEITIAEGKYHQVKRMFLNVGNEVLFLKRIAMGELTLDESLKPGEYRKLTGEEIEILRK